MSYIEDNGYLIFNGEKSSDYGVWVNGGGTFNAPVRRIKEYVVPGRNGTLTIDEGVFDDIEHTYSAFIPKDFSTNIEAFRNVLMANGGYVELEDSFHPNEYYRARYVNGLEADVAPGGVGGAFDIRFRRDPRRFLKTGREIVSYPYGERNSPNLLTYPYSQSSIAVGNMRWNDNGNGIVSASGYHTSGVSVSFSLKTSQANFTLPVGDYVLTGCPQGGSSSTYCIRLATSGSASYQYDYGNGLEFSVTDETQNYIISIYIAGEYTDVNGLTSKPMIQNKYGENIIAWPYHDGESKTTYGVTFTATDGSIATSGTNSGTTYSRYIIRKSSSEAKRIYLTGGAEYKLTGCPQGGSSTTYFLYLHTSTGGSYYDYGDGKTFTATDDTYITDAYINVQRNVDATGLVFKPLLQPTSPVEVLPFTPYWNMGTGLYNPTFFESRPFIKITGNGTSINGTVTINGNSITIASSGCEYLYIDSESQECYTDYTIPVSNMNDKVTFEEHKFPVLKPGANSISYSGDITKVEITPQWWVL